MTSSDKIKKIAKLTFSFLVLALFLYLLLRNVDLKKVGDAFAEANWAFIVLSLLFIPLSLVVRVWRWKYLLNVYADIGFGSLFEVTCVSRALANVLPFRAADIVQAVHLGEKHRISTVAVLASVASERVMDLLFLLLFFIVLSFFMFFPPHLKWYVGGVLLAITGLFFLAIRSIGRIQKFVSRFSPRIGEKVAMIENGVVVFKDPVLFMKASLLTLAGWLLTIVSSGIVLYAFGVRPSLMALLAFNVLPALATIVPSSPGFIGVWDYFAVLSLTAFHIDKAVALSATTVAHATGIAGTSIFGFYYLGRAWLRSAGIAAGKRPPGSPAGEKSR